MNEALTELLDDLSHDLGKYMTLGLRFLPADGTDLRSDLLKAVEDGLLRTHRKDGVTVPAHEVWARWLVKLDEVDPGYRLRELQSYTALVSAMDTALSWVEPQLDEERILANAHQVRMDLMAVPDAIKALIREARKAL